MNTTMVRFMKLFPNLLTLLRILLVCLLNFYIIFRFGSLPIPIVIFLLIFLTDFLDGKIARFYGNTSDLGAVFDILADLFYIVISYIVLNSFHILPLWFLLIILFKFAEFIFTSIILRNLSPGKSIFVFDLIGRITAVFFYMIPMLAYTSFLYSQLIYFFIVNIFTIIITFMAFVSSAYRLRNCAKVLIIKRNSIIAPYSKSPFF